MSDLYDDAHEAAAHEEAIESLASETRLPAHAVRAVYEREYARLKSEASVREFLLLFTVRRAREALARFDEGGGQSGPEAAVTRP